MLDVLRSLHNYVGILGVILVLYAYFAMQIGRMNHDSFLFSILNFVGSCLVLFSLYFSVNIASVVIEVAWLLISLIGIIKAIYSKPRLS
mgnify:CR=1 FL=1|jgi:hypothetical protein